jgi:hypothetical protein
MRTQGVFYADTPHQGGFFIHGASQLQTDSANLAIARNAIGDWSLNRTATGAETYHVLLQLDELKRLIEVSTTPMPFQEQFGKSAGTSGWPAGTPGLPPFTGASQLTPPTQDVPKGLRILSVWVAYQVGVVDLTSATIGVSRTGFGNNLANVITPVLAATAIAKTAAGDATGPYLSEVAIAAPVFENLDSSDILIEATFVMANTGTLRVYAIGFDCDFNYN